jgi:hypothetical protein
MHVALPSLWHGVMKGLLPPIGVMHGSVNVLERIYPYAPS